MEETHLSSESSLEPEQRRLQLRTGPEGDLQNRIRSLLLSRNDKRPPKTPCSTPDYVYLSSHSDYMPLSNQLAPQRKHSFSLAKASAKLEQLRLLDQKMGATRFDGSAGQFREEPVRIPRRSSSGIEMPRALKKPTATRTGSGSGSGLNVDLPASGKSFSRNEIPNRLRLKPHDQNKNGVPKISFTLRTVAPKLSGKQDQRPNLEHRHVPGSYRSEIDLGPQSKVKTESPINKPLVLPAGTELILEQHIHSSPFNAVDALHKIQDHLGEIKNSPHGTVQSRRSRLSFPSQENLSDSVGMAPNLGNSMSRAKTDSEIPPKQSVPPDIHLRKGSKSGAPVGNHSSIRSHRIRHAQLSDIHRRDVNIRGKDELRTQQNLCDLPPLPDSSDNASLQSAAEPVTESKGHNIEGDSRPDLVSPLALSGSLESSDAFKLQPNVYDKSSKPVAPPHDSLQPSGNVGSVRRQSLAPSTLSKLQPREATRSNELYHTIPGKVETTAAVYRPDSIAEHTSTDDSTSFLRKHQQQSESFTKVIADLESLLKEALQIADRDADSGKNSVHERLVSVPEYQAYSGPDHVSTPSSDHSDSTYGESDLETASMMIYHKPDQRNGRSVTIQEPSSDDYYHGHFRKAHQETPFARSAAGTRKSSAIPAEEIDSTELDPEITTEVPARLPDIVVNSAHDSLDVVRDGIMIRTNDWALPTKPEVEGLSPFKKPASLQVARNAPPSHPIRDREHSSEASRTTAKSLPRPSIQARRSSLAPKSGQQAPQVHKKSDQTLPSEESGSTSGPYVADFENSALQYHPVIREVMDGFSSPQSPSSRLAPRVKDEDFALRKETDPQLVGQHSRPTNEETQKGYTLRDRHHFSIREPHGFSLSRSHRRAPIARDWNTTRKRFVATVTCINTAFLGLVVGIYAGEVPAIQYTIADEHHYTILGNVVLFLGLAITTIIFWPLPLLHGRKPYTMGALIFLMLLQFPQALVVASARNPYVATYRVGLLVPRALAGLAMGFANINFKTTLLDLFGASLQSGNPHQEIVNEYDVRRHGGGMGVWLGIWTWCAIGSIGTGFWIGASIISRLNVPWGFWITIIINAFVLLLNVITPEVRRSPYRRSMAEVRTGTDVSRRIARGEIKMHLKSTGPVWWWEEVRAGLVLSLRMLKQPGFAVLSFYMAWIYGQVVLLIVLLGALLSKYYYFHPQFVGLSVAIIPLGAFLAMPFQKASLFSRSRHHQQRTDSMTFEKRVTWTSHLVRRATFMIALPFAGLAYTLSSHGPPTHYMIPIIFAGLIGFLSNLAIAECNGLIMETFDTSDLQPGMTGRPRRELPEETRKKRTNFSCFPRVSAAFAITQSFAFCIAAAATGWGGVIERHVGAQTATAIMAGVLLVVTLMLIAVLTRRKVVQIIPTERFGTNILTGPEDEWKPIVIGNPSGTTRRISKLELGSLSRWSEIRRRNRLGT